MSGSGYSVPHISDLPRAQPFLSIHPGFSEALINSKEGNGIDSLPYFHTLSHMITDALTKPSSSPVLNLTDETSTGGAYIVKTNGEPIAVLKPADEEVYNTNNPKGYCPRTTNEALLADLSVNIRGLGVDESELGEMFESDSESSRGGKETSLDVGRVRRTMNASGKDSYMIRHGVMPGEGLFREVAAYVLDHGNFARVPPTALCLVRDPTLFTSAAYRALYFTQACATSVELSLNKEDEYVKALDTVASLYKGRPGNSSSGVETCSDQDSIGSRDLELSTPSISFPIAQSIARTLWPAVKLASIQAFVPHSSTLDDLGCGLFPVEDVQRIAILDIRLGNTDRHEDNILLRLFHNDDSLERLKKEEEEDVRQLTLASLRAKSEQFSALNDIMSLSSDDEEGDEEIREEALSDDSDSESLANLDVLNSNKAGHYSKKYQSRGVVSEKRGPSNPSKPPSHIKVIEKNKSLRRRVRRRDKSAGVISSSMYKQGKRPSTNVLASAAATASALLVNNGHSYTGITSNSPELKVDSGGQQSPSSSNSPILGPSCERPIEAIQTVERLWRKKLSHYSPAKLDPQCCDISSMLVNPSTVGLALRNPPAGSSVHVSPIHNMTALESSQLNVMHLTENSSLVPFPQSTKKRSRHSTPLWLLSRSNLLTARSAPVEGDLDSSMASLSLAPPLIPVSSQTPARAAAASVTNGAPGGLLSSRAGSQISSPSLTALASATINVHSHHQTSSSIGSLHTSRSLTEGLLTKGVLDPRVLSLAASPASPLLAGLRGYSHFDGPPKSSSINLNLSNLRGTGILQPSSNDAKLTAPTTPTMSSAFFRSDTTGFEVLSKGDNVDGLKGAGSVIGALGQLHLQSLPPSQSISTTSYDPEDQDVLQISEKSSSEVTSFDFVPPVVAALRSDSNKNDSINEEPLVHADIKAIDPLDSGLEFSRTESLVSVLSTVSTNSVVSTPSTVLGQLQASRRGVERLKSNGSDLLGTPTASADSTAAPSSSATTSGGYSLNSFPGMTQSLALSTLTSMNSGGSYPVLTSLDALSRSSSLLDSASVSGSAVVTPNNSGSAYFPVSSSVSLESISNKISEESEETVDNQSSVHLKIDLPLKSLPLLESHTHTPTSTTAESSRLSSDTNLPAGSGRSSDLDFRYNSSSTSKSDQSSQFETESNMDTSDSPISELISTSSAAIVGEVAAPSKRQKDANDPPKDVLLTDAVRFFAEGNGMRSHPPKPPHSHAPSHSNLNNQISRSSNQEISNGNSTTVGYFSDSGMKCVGALLPNCPVAHAVSAATSKGTLSNISSTPSAASSVPASPVPPTASQSSSGIFVPRFLRESAVSDNLSINRAISTESAFSGTSSTPPTPSTPLASFSRQLSAYDLTNTKGSGNGSDIRPNAAPSTSTPMTNTNASIIEFRPIQSYSAVLRSGAPLPQPRIVGTSPEERERPPEINFRAIKAAGRVELVPIDHGLCLPSVFAVDDLEFTWASWSQTRQPIFPAALQYVASLDGRKDALLLWRVFRGAIPPNCLLMLRLSTALLKMGAHRGLTLSEIGKMMSRVDGVGRIGDEGGQVGAHTSIPNNSVSGGNSNSGNMKITSELLGHAAQAAGVGEEWRQHLKQLRQLKKQKRLAKKSGEVLPSSTPSPLSAPSTQASGQPEAERFLPSAFEQAVRKAKNLVRRENQKRKIGEQADTTYNISHYLRNKGGSTGSSSLGSTSSAAAGAHGAAHSINLSGSNNLAGVESSTVPTNSLADSNSTAASLVASKALSAVGPVKLPWNVGSTSKNKKKRKQDLQRAKAALAAASLIGTSTGNSHPGSLASSPKLLPFSTQNVSHSSQIQGANPPTSGNQPAAPSPALSTHSVGSPLSLTLGASPINSALAVTSDETVDTDDAEAMKDRLRDSFSSSPHGSLSRSIETAGASTASGSPSLLALAPAPACASVGTVEAPLAEEEVEPEIFAYHDAFEAAFCVIIKAHIDVVLAQRNKNKK